MKILTKRLPRLGYHSDKNEFFLKLRVSSLFTYSLAYSFSEVRSIADDRGLVIEYCKPGTPEYEKYGSVTVIVIEDKLQKKEQIFHFDPQHLDT